MSPLLVFPRKRTIDSLIVPLVTKYSQERWLRVNGLGSFHEEDEAFCNDKCGSGQMVNDNCRTVATVGVRYIKLRTQLFLYKLICLFIYLQLFIILLGVAHFVGWHK